MNALVPFSPIPPLSNPAQLPSLPGWLQQRSAALGSAVQPDSSGKYSKVPILPKDMILNTTERAEVQRHIVDLQRYTRLDQTITLRETTMSNDAALVAMIAALLLKGGRRLDRQSSDAATEDYLDALEDVPAWSVREALRKWNRGESPPLDAKPHDFNWRPEPPTLRRLALHELAGVKGRILHLQKLCSAEPLIEYSDEHRKAMLERLRDVVRMPAANSSTEEAAE